MTHALVHERLGRAMSDNRNEAICNTDELPYWQDRDLSWLSFAERVLDQGHDETVPLLDRSGFISYFQSDLRAFVEQRVGSLADRAAVLERRASKKDKPGKGKSGKASSDKSAKQRYRMASAKLRAIYDRIGDMSEKAKVTYEDACERLRGLGVDHIFGARLHDDLPEYQHIFLHEHLKKNVYRYLAPYVVDALSPFPYLEDDNLYIVVELADKKADKKAANGKGDSGSKKVKRSRSDGSDLKLGIVALPEQCVRVIELPTGDGKNMAPGDARLRHPFERKDLSAYSFVLLEDALCLFAKDIFPNHKVGDARVVSLIRNADLGRFKHIDVDDGDYLDEMDEALDEDAGREPLLLMLDGAVSKPVKKMLKKGLGLKSHQMQISGLPLDMSYVSGMVDHLSDDVRKRLSWEGFEPKWLRSGPLRLNPNFSILDQISDHDVLLSYPYESMEPFLMMLDEASVDPDVSAIDITLYRLAPDSEVAKALMEAAYVGKRVRVVIELRASFAEEKNIEWAKRFEEAGCEVFFGLEDYKVHGKICCITRSVNGALQRIVQLGTGNYDEQTAKRYTDLCFMTSDPDIGSDAIRMFDALEKGVAPSECRVLKTSPFRLQDMIIDNIDEQIERAQHGDASGIFFKVNAVTDRDIIEKLVEASQAGVPVVMIVRDSCCVLPGIEGHTEKIRIASMVGRVLEHSRIYGFGAWDDMRIYLSSADLMGRNMHERVEIAWPIENNILRKRIIQYVNLCLNDTAKLRELLPDGAYTDLGELAKEDEHGRKELFDSQDYLLRKG